MNPLQEVTNFKKSKVLSKSLWVADKAAKKRTTDQKLLEAKVAHLVFSNKKLESALKEALNRICQLEEINKSLTENYEQKKELENELFEIKLLLSLHQTK